MRRRPFSRRIGIDPRLPRFHHGRTTRHDRAQRDSRREHARDLRAAARPRSAFLRQSVSHGAARHFQIPGPAGERNLEAVPRTSRGPSLDDREDGDRPHSRDGGLLLLSLRPGSDHATAVARYRPDDRRAPCPRHHRFVHHLVPPRLLCRHRRFISTPALFHGGVCPAGPDRDGKTISLSRHPGQHRAFFNGRAGRLLLVAAKNDPVFLSRHAIAGLGADLDRTGVLRLRDPLHDRVRTRLRTAGRRPGARALWPYHLRIHGAHPALRGRSYVHLRHHHQPDAGCYYDDRDGIAVVLALRELHLDHLVCPAKTTARGPR